MFQMWKDCPRRMMSSDGTRKFRNIQTINIKKDKQEKINSKRNSFKPSKSRPAEPNKFLGNTGAARSMRAIGFEDGDDPALTYVFGTGSFPDSPRDPRDSMEDLYEETKGYQRDLKLNKANPISKSQLCSILTKKNFYPDPEPPTLLTWAEKQTIRHLHDTEPGEWTAKKLSECFPAADERVVKGVIKNRNPPEMNTAQATKHDNIVRENWRLLTQGKLNDKLGTELLSHLVKFGPSLVKGGNFSGLSPSSLRQLEETMLSSKNIHHNEPFKINPKSCKGPFGSIIADYQNKLELRNTKEGKIIEKNNAVMPKIVEGKHLLKDGDDTINKLGHKHPRDPKRGTSLINVNINLNDELPMTMNTFKSIFADNLKDGECDQKSDLYDSNRVPTLSPVAQMKKEFLNWLGTENKKINPSISPNNNYSRDISNYKSRNTRMNRSKDVKKDSKESLIVNQDLSKSKWIQKMSYD